MKVWFCADGGYAEKEELEICQLHEGFNCGWMQLVPVDAVVIEKVDGKWSDSTLLAFDTAAHALVETRHGSEDLRMAFDVFVAAMADALAEAQP